MAVMLGFLTGAAVGIAAYRYMYAERYRQQEVSCNEREKDKDLQKQLERLIAYSGREA